MPGTPVLATYCDFSYPGVYTGYKDFHSEYFFKSSDDMQQMKINYEDEKGKTLQFNPGETLVSGHVKKELFLSNSEQEVGLNHMKGRSGRKGYYCDINLALIWFIKQGSAEDGQKGKTDPSFHIFSKEVMTGEMLSDLKTIRFDGE